MQDFVVPGYTRGEAVREPLPRFLPLVADSRFAVRLIGTREVTNTGTGEVDQRWDCEVLATSDNLLPATGPQAGQAFHAGERVTLPRNTLIHNALTAAKAAAGDGFQVEVGQKVKMKQKKGRKGTEAWAIAVFRLKAQ